MRNQCKGQPETREDRTVVWYLCHAVVEAFWRRRVGVAGGQEAARLIPLFVEAKPRTGRPQNGQSTRFLVAS